MSVPPDDIDYQTREGGEGRSCMVAPHIPGRKQALGTAVIE